MEDAARSSTFVLDVIAANGVPFRAVAVPAGVDGPNPHRTKGSKHALVEFYDRRYPIDSEHGQFIGRYDFETLLAGGTQPRRRLDLCGHVDDWKLDVDTYAVVLRWMSMLGLDQPRPAVRLAAERVRQAGVRVRETFPEATAVLVEATADSGRVAGVYASGDPGGHYALWTLSEESADEVGFVDIDDVSSLLVAALADDLTLGTPIRGAGGARWLVKV